MSVEGIGSPTVPENPSLRCGRRYLVGYIGVMGKQESGAEESFSDSLLEYPQYTRPQAFEGREIPEILISGDHAKVAAWRKAGAEALTRARRPDLWALWQKTAKNTTDG